MLRTAEQIAELIGAETQAVLDFLATRKTRAAREDGQTKYYDEATQLFISSHVKRTRPVETHDKGRAIIMTQEDMQALRAMMGEVVAEQLKPIEVKLDSLDGRIGAIEGRLDHIEQDIDDLKESADITQDGVSKLEVWAEKADKVLNIGLYKEG